jgi:hypothetical protein
VARASGARVVVESGAPACLAGVLLSSRPVVVNRAGDVEVAARRFLVRAGEEAVLATARSFVRVASEEVELYGQRVLARAREVAKILGRLIALN